jgi:RNA polymerase sigma-70 factor (ECF subfamily)
VSRPGSQPVISTILPQPGSEERKSSDEEAGLHADFDATLAEVRDELLVYLRRRLGDREIAADLTQETLLRMLKYRESPEIKDRRAMLFRIAHNLVLEYRRAQYRHHAAQHVSLDDVVPLRMDQPAMETVLDARRAIDRLLNCTLANLPPKCRLAFMLNRFDGLTYPQVAARMGISVKMVEKHITRALVACRLAVGDRDFQAST